VRDDAFWALVRGRRSVRRYAAQPVPGELVEKLLEAAHWAPSAHNRQPWRFVVLNEAARRRRLAEAMAEHWQADLLADGADPAQISRRAALSVQRIAGAPLAILPCLDLDALDRYPDPQRQRREWQMGVQSVALACQNLLLAAHNYGLVACWMCAPIFCPDLVQATLDLPASWEPQALLTIGYPPDDALRSKERAPLATRVAVR
jgi:F420 biosynthesis protein FbiB-like protein